MTICGSGCYVADVTAYHRRGRRQRAELRSCSIANRSGDVHESLHVPVSCRSGLEKAPDRLRFTVIRDHRR